MNPIVRAGNCNNQGGRSASSLKTATELKRVNILWPFEAFVPFFLQEQSSVNNFASQET